MKKVFLSIAIALVSYFAYAQNTFPSSGSVGIGTTSPATAFDIELNQNGTQGIYVNNASTGTSARTRFANF